MKTYWTAPNEGATINALWVLVSTHWSKDPNAARLAQKHLSRLADQVSNACIRTNLAEGPAPFSAYDWNRITACDIRPL